MPKNKLEYDFNFICLSFGLLPVMNGRVAINPGAITEIVLDESGGAVIKMHNNPSLPLNAEDMAELETTIKRRGEEMKAIQREAMRSQAEMQAGLMAEMQGGIKPVGGGLIGMLPGMNKRGKN